MRLTPNINKTIKMMSQREYNWPFLLHKQIISPNAGPKVLMMPLRWPGNLLATEQSCHRPLEWTFPSCYLHPGNIETGSSRQSKNKFNGFISQKQLDSFDNDSIHSVSFVQFASTRVSPTELGKITQTNT